MSGRKLVLTEKIWRLTPIKQLDKKDSRRRYLWSFLCDCGNMIEASASDVKLGRIKSCGCLPRECGERLKNYNKLPDKMGSINKIFGSYKRSAIRRGYSFDIDLENFKILISSNCFYCGSIPSNRISLCLEKTEENTLVYNGVDRKDNNIGYTIDNCVPSCYICNKMKMDLNFDIFIRKVIDIYEHRNLRV